MFVEKDGECRPAFVMAGRAFETGSGSPREMPAPLISYRTVTYANAGEYVEVCCASG